MPPKPLRAGGPAVGARVLLLARTVDALPDVPPWDPRSPRWPWTAAAGGPPATDPRGYDVAPVGTDVPSGDGPGGRAGRRGRVGAALARLRGRGGAEAPETAPAWSAELSSGSGLRTALRGTDVVWSLDEDTDAALAARPELVGGRTVLGSSTWAAGSAALADLEALLSEVVEAGGRTGEDAPGRWRATAATLATDALPDALRACDTVVEALRVRRRRRGGLAADRAAVALDAAAWPPTGRGRSGLAARRSAADLSLGTLPWDEVDEDVLGADAQAAARGADEALDADDVPLALARLGDGVSLLFHRARHAEVPRSALVDDPAAFLRPLHSSRTYRTLLGPWRPAVGDRPAPPATGTDLPSRPEPGAGRPRVLVVTGAYGDFHGGVVAALQDGADVRVRDLTQEHRELGRKVLDPWALPAVAALAAGGPPAPDVDADLPGWADRRLARQVHGMTGPLRHELGWPGVVLADWADPATVWVSHLCPPSTRLVVRVHALDALDPWLHLVRWERVERVLTVSEPHRSLVADLLAAAGWAGVPVSVVPHAVTALPDLARDKTDGARTTLGMVGWNRRVKDVHWALDLLERDPSWQLVLVGADFPASATPVVAPFVARLRERLVSPQLRDRVHLVGQVDDVGEPLRRVGVILSSSVRESWHLGLVEGAASGAVPVVRDWPLLAARGGPRTLFPQEWVVDDLDEAEERVRRVTAPETWEQESARAHEQALALFDPAAVAETYRRLLLDAPRPTP